MSDWFDFTSPLVRKTRARAEQVNGIFTEIKTAFLNLPTKARIFEARVHYCGATTGVAGSYVATPPYAFTLTDGATISVKVHASNAGASTINVYGLGVLPVVDFAGNALTGGEMPLGAFVDLRYDQAINSWKIISPLVDVGVVTVNNLSSVSATDTTPGYLQTKINALGAIAERVTSSGADERLQIKMKASGHLSATGTIHIGGMQTVSTASGAITLYCPPNGAGDASLQDGDTWELLDTGGQVEANAAQLDGNGKNIKFMSQSAAATLDWVGPNYSRLRGVFSVADDRWNVTGV